MPSYPEILTKIFDLQKFGMKFGLDSMVQLLTNLGQPNLGGIYVHLAGTNGKGSTAVTLASILTKAGYKTGLYTSPHLVTFRERIQIDSMAITESEVADLAQEVWKAVDVERLPTFFEFVTAMALIYFRRCQVDIAVIECGLGGRLDSTNVLTPLLTAITNVSLEHTEYLGNTIAQIAWEKSGIIKEGVPFVGGRLNPEALKVVENTLAEKKVSQCFFLGRDFVSISVDTDKNARQTIDYRGPKWRLNNLRLALSGPHQADNAAIALCLAELLTDKGFDVPLSAVEAGLAAVVWPGRAESFKPGEWPISRTAKAPLLLDGAHNPDGAIALSQLLSKASRKRLHLILGVMADKDITGVLGPIIAHADRLYLTRPVYARAASPELLLERLTAVFGPPLVETTLYQSLPDALGAAAEAAEADDLVVVSGSLFTVGEARAYLTGAPVVESN
ncbi:MAG: bifunctional folylpolyglutamate synthase/dihydrofolate synthase [Deltaproteobacteria bacterium]|jgi:dihydrofolate synthase/folylpolyglutamate synthase|nr:bifunctional folylpolyglutamate synthase/dihydrofolate synthase [Deltaproteobacteria bacterium]